MNKVKPSVDKGTKSNGTSDNKDAKTELKPNRPEISEKPKCGIVMPISSIDGCSEGHWAEVRGILSDAIADAGFIPNLVSDSDDVGVIQKRIVQNLYDNPIVVCDVSAKNANVMFELGLRLAFDKPTIIVIDDSTNYSFDTSPIEHVKYPRDLRFNKIIDFKTDLSEKIKATCEKAEKDPDFSTFLKHFGKFKVAGIQTEEIGKDEFILQELKNIRTEMAQIESIQRTSHKVLEVNNGISKRQVLIKLHSEVAPYDQESEKAIDWLSNIIPKQSIMVGSSNLENFESVFSFKLDIDKGHSIVKQIHRNAENILGKYEIKAEMVNL